MGARSHSLEEPISQPSKRQRLALLVVLAVSTLALTGCPEEGDRGVQPYAAMVPCDFLDIANIAEVAAGGVEISIRCVSEAQEFGESLWIDWAGPDRQLGLEAAMSAQLATASRVFVAPVCGPDGILVFGARPADDPGFDLAFQIFYQALALRLEGNVVGEGPWECDSGA